MTLADSDLKRELVRFTELRTLAPAPQIPSWISIHLSTNVSGKSYQRWKKRIMDNPAWERRSPNIRLAWGNAAGSFDKHQEGKRHVS